MGLNGWVGTANGASVRQWFETDCIDFTCTAYLLNQVSTADYFCQYCFTLLKCVDWYNCQIEEKKKIIKGGINDGTFMYKPIYKKTLLKIPFHIHLYC